MLEFIAKIDNFLIKTNLKKFFLFLRGSFIQRTVFSYDQMTDFRFGNAGYLTNFACALKFLKKGHGRYFFVVLYEENREFFPGTETPGTDIFRVL